MRSSVAKLLAPTVPLVLTADGGHKLELKLAWTMRAVMLIETKLRALGIHFNVLQDPARFWKEMDCTSLSIAVWACAWQEHLDLQDEDGFDVISSFLITENWAPAAAALKDCFLESLSEERRKEIKEKEKASVPETPDPTNAPAQS